MPGPRVLRPTATRKYLTASATSDKDIRYVLVEKMIEMIIKTAEYCDQI